MSVNLYVHYLKILIGFTNDSSSSINTISSLYYDNYYFSVSMITMMLIVFLAHVYKSNQSTFNLNIITPSITKTINALSVVTNSNVMKVDEYKKTSDTSHFFPMYNTEDKTYNDDISKKKELIMLLDSKGYVLFANHLTLLTFKYNIDDILGESIMEVYRSLGHNDENWLDIIKTELSHNNLIKIKHGSYEKWVLMNYTANLDLLGDIESISIKGNDVSYLIESNSIKEFYSERDQLTGLVNQYGMFDIIKQMKHVNSAVAFFVEVLNFTEISNYYGHNIGDKLIKSVVNELKKTVSKECLIVRYTESKFVLLCSGKKINKESLNLKINKLKEFIKSSYKIENLDLQVDKRIGYAIYPEDTNNFEDLVSLSSLALRNSISNSSIEITRFTPDMLKTLKYNVELGNKLREALDKESIEVFFQKAINCSTDEVFIIEELSRWYDKDLGYIPPLEYFKIAKESNQLDRLDRYMVKKSLESFVKLRLNKEYTKSKITINIAPSTLLDVNFFDYFNKTVDEMGVLPEDIYIEISESTFINKLDLCVSRISLYKNKGYSIALDDFGIEYSSLSVLESVDFDMIKIDAHFVKNIDKNSNQEIIKMIRKITEMTYKKIVAEGVETKEQSDLLRELGCSIQQGYYLHKPENLLLF